MSIAERSTPPLICGDKLSRGEFLRRWHAHPDIKKAELIGGVVYMPSPVTVDHGHMEFNVTSWLSIYSASTPGTNGCNNTTTFLLDDSPQPDVLLRILSESGGSSRVEDDYIHGPFELAVEVCRSSTAYDLHQKLELYRQAGVQECLAVLMYEQEIRWHRLENDEYRLLLSSSDGVWRSQVFPGLWLDGKPLLDGNMGGVLATLNQGLQSPEHAKFVAELAARKIS